jgi:hypothetical protein
MSAMMSESVGITSTSEASVLSNVEHLSNATADGTSDNLCIVMMKTDCLERSVVFEVVFLEGLEHDHCRQNVFHIWKVPAHGRESFWSASLPTTKCPSIAHHCILVGGPSRDHWHSDAARCHRDGFCDLLQVAHEAQDTSIDGDMEHQLEHPGTSRAKQFWRLEDCRGTRRHSRLIFYLILSQLGALGGGNIQGVFFGRVELLSSCWEYG